MDRVGVKQWLEIELKWTKIGHFECQKINLYLSIEGGKAAQNKLAIHRHNSIFDGNTKRRRNNDGFRSSMWALICQPAIQRKKGETGSSEF
jgi:hypothetical protein